MTAAPGTRWTFWQNPDPSVIGTDSYSWSFLLKVDLVAIIVLLGFFSLPPVQAWTGCDVRLIAAGFFIHFAYSLTLLLIGIHRVNPRMREFFSHLVNMIAVVAIPLSSDKPLFALWILFPLIVWMDAYGSPKSVAAVLTSILIPFADPLWHWGAPNMAGKAMMAGLSVIVGMVIYFVTSYFTIWSRTNMRQRAELERLKAAEAERERIGRTLHGTLGAALSEITLWQEIALAGSGSGGNGGMADDATAPLTRAHERAKSALTELRTLVAGLDETPGGGARVSAGDVAAAVRRQIEGLCDAAGVRLAYTEPPPGDTDRASAYHLAKIVVEAVTNAVRHARASQIAVTFNLSPLHVAVVDDGAGFDPGLTSHGRGLRSLNEHAAALGGAIVLDAAPAAGTRVLFNLNHATPSRDES